MPRRRITPKEKLAADVYIRANPWEAVAIAAGIGFIFGTLARRR